MLPAKREGMLWRNRSLWRIASCCLFTGKRGLRLPRVCLWFSGRSLSAISRNLSLTTSFVRPSRNITMPVTVKKIDGRAHAKACREELKDRVETLRSRGVQVRMLLPVRG